MLLRDLFEAPGKTAVLAFGRLNPPTIGHAKLVDAIRAQKGDHYLFLSQTQKPKTDPLDFATKMKFAKQFFPDVNVGHQAVRTPVQALEQLQSLGYTDIIFIAGSDRVDGFQKLFDTYNGQTDKAGNIPFKFNSIRVASAGERDPDADGAEGMSASKMRAAAAEGNLEAFAQGVPDKKLAKTMYDAVRKGMGVKDSIAAENTSLDEAEVGTVYMRFTPKKTTDGKSYLTAYAGFANSPEELRVDTASRKFMALTKKEDIIKAIKTVLGDKVFVGAKDMTIYIDKPLGKMFPHFDEFIAWVRQFGKEKVKLEYKPDSDTKGEKGIGKKRLPKGHAASADKNYFDPETATTKYFSIDNQRLMKFLRTKAPQIMNSFRPNLNLFVMDQDQYVKFRKWLSSESVVSKFGGTGVKIDKEKTFSQDKGRKFEDMDPEEEDDFHVDLDKLVHKYFGHSSDEKKDKDVEEAERVLKKSTTGDTKSFRGTANRLPTDNTAGAKDITKKAKQTDVPGGSYELDFDNLDKEKLKKVVAQQINKIPKEIDRKVLQAYFGLGNFEKSYTYDQIGKALGVSRARVRERVLRALRILRHVDRARELRPFLDSLGEDTNRRN